MKKFGRSSHTGNNVRQEKIYKMISQLKWQILKEIRKTYSVHFWEDRIFTPTFETYSTNIRPSNERRNLEFWDSILFDRVADYAPTYNACVCWDYKHGENEGLRLSAFCGGNYSKDDHLPEIAHHDISDIYGVYLTAATLEYVADRDIAICNKKISKVIRKAKTSSVLKVRVAVERKLYYCYRFISEFSGKSIDCDDAKAFRHQFYKKGSVSSRSLEGICKRIQETKTQIDNILKLMNDAAEYRSSESNIKLQWIMMIVTVLSLFVALSSINNNDVVNEIKTKLANNARYLDRFDLKLYKYGYRKNHENEYLENQFRFIEKREYVVNDVFPKLVAENVSSEIVSCKYELSLAAIEKYRR